MRVWHHLFMVDIGDITYEAPTKLPMESEGIRSIGLESGGNAGIETLKQTTIQLQEMLLAKNQVSQSLRKRCLNKLIETFFPD